MRELGAFCGQRLVVKRGGGVGIEREVELVLPTEFEPRLGKEIIAFAGARMAEPQPEKVSSFRVQLGLPQAAPVVGAVMRFVEAVRALLPPQGRLI